MSPIAVTHAFAPEKLLQLNLKRRNAPVTQIHSMSVLVVITEYPVIVLRIAKVLVVAEKLVKYSQF